nr:immunoglobulin heavy chain junction region [Macaca mulatta]MOX60995.1 immunoglobulin heavy chain junction region [Macaca mulatta]MOX63257.1 immunoglobulin heavy chain junction region [Macaca mulatta]MOX64970.1 immunoglobulin heavy chain junction region [Macaca mulatta]MOX66398.1 immunoglobulin heavy chain junction region [Macaca mulatta]
CARRLWGRFDSW